MRVGNKAPSRSTPNRRLWRVSRTVLLGLPAVGFLAGCESAAGPPAVSTTVNPSTNSTVIALPTETLLSLTATSYTVLQGSRPAPEFGITVNGDLRVIDIVRGEGADKAGVQLGDVLKALNGTALTSTDQARPIITAITLAAATNPQAAALTVTRKGRDITLQIVATPPLDRGGSPGKPLLTATPIFAPNDYY